MDKLTPQARSENMRRIKSRDMKPEIAVRKLVHSLGYRFRLHRKDVPGKPDLVFPSRRAVIFVHGCFWRQHPSPACSDSRMPKSNRRYWRPKLTRNRARDAEHAAALRAMGWRVMVVWECQTKKLAALARRIGRFLDRKVSKSPAATPTRRGWPIARPPSSPRRRC